MPEIQTIEQFIQDVRGLARLCDAMADILAETEISPEAIQVYDACRQLAERIGRKCEGCGKFRFDTTAFARRRHIVVTDKGQITYEGDVWLCPRCFRDESICPIPK